MSDLKELITNIILIEKNMFVVRQDWNQIFKRFIDLKYFHSLKASILVFRIYGRLPFLLLLCRCDGEQ